MRRLGAVIAFALVLPSAGCAFLLSLLNGSLQRPTLSVRNLELTSFTLDELTLQLDCDVDNPNAFALDLARFEYSLALDGHPLVGGTLNKGLSVPAQGHASVGFPMSFRLADAGLAIADLLQKDAVAYDLKTTLGFNSPIGVVDVPINKSGTLPVPRLPDLHLDGARLAGVGFSGADLGVRISLGNRNHFALPLGALQYSIAIDGSVVASGSTAAPTLPADGNAVLEIPIHIDFFGAGRAVMSAVESRRITVHLTGALDVARFHKSLPVDEQATLDL